MPRASEQMGRRPPTSRTDPSLRKGDAKTIEKVSVIPPKPRSSHRFPLIARLPFWFATGTQEDPAGCDKMQILKDMSRKEKLSEDFFPVWLQSAEVPGDDKQKTLRQRPKSQPVFLQKTETRIRRRRSVGTGYGPLNNRGLPPAVLLQTAGLPIHSPFRPDRRTPAILRRYETP